MIMGSFLDAFSDFWTVSIGVSGSTLQALNVLNWVLDTNSGAVMYFFSELNCIFFADWMVRMF